jgi:amidase
MSDLVFSTVHELAAAIREGKVSAEEAVDAHLKHIDRHNPALNAIVTLNEEEARRRAKEADADLKEGNTWGPLHGVPVTIKDTFETAGLRTTSSFKPLADYIPRQDATVVSRMREAGAIILGKTNLPELAFDCQSNSPLFGPANNPWDVRRTPGGSTGGGAAAVAAGLSPLEIGSDIGGSIRIPAHFCGLYGLKPTEHRVPMTGHIPELPGAPKGVRHMGVVGALARSVEDLQLCLTLIAGPDGREWEVPPVGTERPPESVLSDCRFAWTDKFGDVPVTEDTRAALKGIAESLANLGCQVEYQKPPEFDFAGAWRTWGEMCGAEIGAATPALPRFLMRMKFWMMPGSSPLQKGLIRGAGLSMPRYVKALSRRDGFIEVLERFLETWDAWLCPVAAVPAFTHRKMGAAFEVNGEEVPYLMATAGYTTIFNMTGSPVVVLPVSQSKDGLPIGVQVVGRRWGDMELLAIAAQLAEAIGSFQRPPGY